MSNTTKKAQLKHLWMQIRAVDRKANWLRQQEENAFWAKRSGVEKHIRQQKLTCFQNSSEIAAIIDRLNLQSDQK